MDAERIRILIADDHPLFRDGLHGLLDSVPDTEVVGEATDGKEAIALADSLQPDVILMDLKMPGVNGLEAMREILHTSPHIRILVVSMLEDDDSVFAASPWWPPNHGPARWGWSRWSWCSRRTS